MKSADKSILLLASLIDKLGLTQSDITQLIPNYDEQEYKERLNKINFEKKQDITKLLKELYSSGMKKGKWW